MKINKGYTIPNNLELKPSPLHGLGMFATEFIPKKTNLGVCHYYDFTNKRYLRNSFVPFFNYSKKRNAYLAVIRKKFKNGYGYITELITTENIKKGEEILLTYTWYDPTKPNTKDNKHYIPLPSCVSIKKIDNKYCLYATKDIIKDFDLGTSHGFYDKTEVYEPNAIGGYIIESNNPNAILIKKENDIHIKTNSFIKKGSLISVNYGNMVG